jgi:hypothetical protein
MRQWNRGLCVFLFCAVIAPCGCASLGEWMGEWSMSEDGRITGKWESAPQPSNPDSGSAAVESVVAIGLAAAAALGVPFAYPVQRALRRRRDERAVTEHRKMNGES